LSRGEQLDWLKNRASYITYSRKKNKKCVGLEAHTSNLQQGTESWSSSQIWLQHKRLGHPPFSTLKSLFPVLFTKLSVESFHCDVCQFAKHGRTTFTPNNNINSKPFDPIHSNVWGPSPICNILGAKWFVSFIDDCTRVTGIFLIKNKSKIFSLVCKFLPNGSNTI